jgi:hypothetical protein
MKERRLSVFTESIEEYDLLADGETPIASQGGKETTGDQL